MLVAKQIWEGTFAGSIDMELTNLVAMYLIQAVEQGLNDYKPQYSTTAPELVANLERNVYQFASAKNYQMMRAMTNALYSSNTLREWSEFKTVASQINEQYNQLWLQTEYNAAIASAQMAARWHDAPQDCLLQYRTAGDNRVRDSHARLQGVTLPKKDSFWNTHYPPNGWGCRCLTVEANEKTPVTPKQSIPTVPIDTLWKTNTAKGQLIFPANHPYYIGVPKEILHETFIWKRTQEYEGYGDDYEKISFNAQNGGFFVSHKKHNYDKRGGIIEKLIANILKDKGYKVVALDESKKDETSIDFKINDILWEIKSSNKKSLRSIKSQLETAKNKNIKDLNLIIYLNSDMTIDEAESLLKRLQPTRYNVSNIWLFKKDIDIML